MEPNGIVRGRIIVARFDSSSQPSASVSVGQDRRQRIWEESSLGRSRDRADNMAIAKPDSFNLKPTTTRKQNEVKCFQTALKQQSLLDINVQKKLFQCQDAAPMDLSRPLHLHRIVLAYIKVENLPHTCLFVPSP